MFIQSLNLVVDDSTESADVLDLLRTNDTIDVTIGTDVITCSVSQALEYQGLGYPAYFLLQGIPPSARAALSESVSTEQGFAAKVGK